MRINKLAKMMIGVEDVVVEGVGFDVELQIADAVSRPFAAH